MFDGDAGLRTGETIAVMQLADMGWSAHWQTQWEEVPRPGSRPGRVARSEAGSVTVWTETGSIEAKIPGRLKGSDARPAVGDWVAVARAGRDDVVETVLPRRTVFVRRAAGRRLKRQVVAANVDIVFVVSGLDGDFNPRRLERYLTSVNDAGAQPVILLTKAGLVDDPASFLAQARGVAPDVDVHAMDVVDGLASDAADRYFARGTTAALVGSSGVGKSTLLNHWLGEARQSVGSVRDRDHRGQHTTTAREMFVLPSGSLVVDTPGMRELALWADESALDEAFPDIDALATQCRFTDCRHGAEPGCAVREAVATGTLARDRFASYLALRAEISDTFGNIPTHERRRRGKGLAKAVSQAQKLKRGR